MAKLQPHPLQKNKNKIENVIKRTTFGSDRSIMHVFLMATEDVHLSFGHGGLPWVGHIFSEYHECASNGITRAKISATSSRDLTVTENSVNNHFLINEAWGLSDTKTAYITVRKIDNSIGNRFRVTNIEKYYMFLHTLGF